MRFESPLRLVDMAFTQYPYVVYISAMVTVDMALTQYPYVVYISAMVTVGVTKIDDKPTGGDVDKIFIDTFVRDA